MKILAVEDDTIAALVLESALKSLGHQVVMAKDGEAAWSVLTADADLRVVVSDWKLPGLDGLDLCRMVRATRDRYVSYLLVTEQPPTGANLETAYQAGVDDFLTKPINPVELRMRLHVAERIVDFTAEVRRLESIVPICGYCKKIRDDKDYWQQIEEYVAQRSGARFSHGVCPDCYQRILVPELQQVQGHHCQNVTGTK